mmetsp:Transcript_3270/g.4755  ORF Transcript_3270/g.4755 Transcript_3270/m.4755 type:complete len:122 (+) Transcript_3270:3207-3572(+)
MCLLVFLYFFLLLFFFFLVWFHSILVCVTLVYVMLFESLITFTYLFTYSLAVKVKTNQFDAHETIVQIRKNEQIGKTVNEKSATTRHNCCPPHSSVSGVWIDQLLLFFFFVQVSPAGAYKE